MAAMAARSARAAAHSAPLRTSRNASNLPPSCWLVLKSMIQRTSLRDESPIEPDVLERAAGRNASRSSERASACGASVHRPCRSSNTFDKRRYQRSAASARSAGSTPRSASSRANIALGSTTRRSFQRETLLRDSLQMAMDDRADVHGGRADQTNSGRGGAATPVAPRGGDSASTVRLGEPPQHGHDRGRHDRACSRGARARRCGCATSVHKCAKQCVRRGRLRLGRQLGDEMQAFARARRCDVQAAARVLPRRARRSARFTNSSSGARLHRRANAAAP